MDNRLEKHSTEEAPVPVCGVSSAAATQLVVESHCQDGCPVHLSCHGYISLIKEGKLEDAYKVIRQRLPFPMTLGRVCDHPCEAECRRGQMDQAVAIMDLKRFVADSAYAKNMEYTPKVKDKREERVAIIGAGPAGLSAAYDLARDGFQVTVFEALPIAGGMLAVGCPEYRLPRRILQSEIENVKKLGVEIKLNHRVADVDSLFHQGYRAIFIAAGSHRGRKLAIPGAELEGVLVATSFLRDVNLGKDVQLGKKVLVLGGGSVAYDCARTCLRLGVREVGIACLESPEQMPADPSEIRAGEEEGIVVYPSRTFAKILARNGRVSGVECLSLRWMQFDKDDRLHIDAVTGSEHILEADTVIFAIGQVPDLDFVSGVVGLELTKQGTIALDPGTLVTGLPGVFAGGDAVTNAGSVIQAIASGQRAALSISAYLVGERPSPKAARRDDEVIGISAVPPSEDELKGKSRIMPSVISNDLRRSSFEEVVQCYSEKQAVEEAQRCLRCDLLNPVETMDRFRLGQGGTTEERIQRIEKEGVTATTDFLRRALLHGLGVSRRKTADTVIILGCMLVFGMPVQVLSSLRLLDRLGVEYTFIREKEYCCGVPLVEYAENEAERALGEEASERFNRMNLALARELGAKRIAYICTWCAYMAKKYLANEGIPLLYFPDILLEPDVSERLALEHLSLPPTVVGYYEGCHLRNICYAPGVKINWKRYRQLVERIEGVNIVDLPNWECCVVDSEKIVDEAESKGVKTIVAPCAACWTWLDRPGGKRGIPVKMIQDILLEALGNEGR